MTTDDMDMPIWPSALAVSQCCQLLKPPDGSRMAEAKTIAAGGEGLESFVSHTATVVQERI